MKRLIAGCAKLQGLCAKLTGKEHFPWWHELDDAERNAIRNPQDYPVISVIKGIPKRRILNKIYKSIPLGSQIPGYNQRQLGWVADEEWYLGVNLGHKPSGTEVAGDMTERHLFQQYRLYFAAVKVRNIDRIPVKWNLPTFRFFCQVYREVKRGYSCFN